MWLSGCASLDAPRLRPRRVISLAERFYVPLSHVNGRCAAKETVSQIKINVCFHLFMHEKVCVFHQFQTGIFPVIPTHHGEWKETQEIWSCKLREGFGSWRNGGCYFKDSSCPHWTCQTTASGKEATLIIKGTNGRQKTSEISDIYCNFLTWIHVSD